MWLLEGPTHNDFVRVISYICIGAGILATNNCVAADDECIGRLTELERHSEELKKHFCSCQGDENMPCSLCSYLCDYSPSNEEELECFVNKGQGQLQETRCTSQRDTLKFVCGYQHAIVCADEHEICVNQTLPRDRVSKSFCVCRNANAGRLPVLNGSCINVEVLVIASCISAILVILVIILICCVFKKRKARAKRRSRTSSSKLDKSEDLEYSYAYGYRDRSQSNIQAEDTDLDADQTDHYYSHLKQEGRPNGQGQDKEDSGPDQKVPSQDKDDKEANIEHTYFVLEKMSTGEPAKICSEEDEQMSPPVDEIDTSQPSCAKVTPKAQRHVDSSGYEVAREQRHGDVKTTASNQEESNMQPTVGTLPQSRDSGYEVATVTSRGNNEQERNVPGHSYVTLEPQNGEQSANTDSGYEAATVTSRENNEQERNIPGHSYVTLEPQNGERSANTDSGYEVAKIIEPKLQDEYDHLERKEPFKPREGAIP